MSDDPRQWPAELQTLWAESGLPGLRDFLLAQERLAVEVRKQNQELRRLAAAAPATAPSAPGAKELMLLADAITRLCESLQTVTRETAPPPRRRLFGLLPPAPTQAINSMAITSLIDGARILGDRLRDLLRDCGMQVIEPDFGEAFDPAWHQAVQRSGAAAAGAIDAVIRPGYRRGDTLLRPAEVSVGVSLAGDEDNAEEQAP